MDDRHFGTQKNKNKIIIILGRYLVLVGLANRAEEAVGNSRLGKSPVHIYKWK